MPINPDVFETKITGDELRLGWVFTCENPSMEIKEYDDGDRKVPTYVADVVAINEKLLEVPKTLQVGNATAAKALAEISNKYEGKQFKVQITKTGDAFKTKYQIVDKTSG